MNNEASYTIKCNSRSEVAQALASQLEKGKAGDLLIVDGWSQRNFARFLATFAVRAVAAGFDAEKLYRAFTMLAAGNASQASQALEDSFICTEISKKEAEELKAKGHATAALVLEEKGLFYKKDSLGAFWGLGKGSKGTKPDLSILEV